MSVFSPNIIYNLRRAHPLIDKRNESKIKAFIKIYIAKYLEKKRINLHFNKRIFIKSFLTRLDNYPNNHFLLHKYNSTTIKGKKRNSFDNNSELLITSSKTKLKRSSSCDSIKNEEQNLKEQKYKTILSKKKIDKNIEIEKQDYSFINAFKNNRLILSIKNYQNINKTNKAKSDFINSLKKNSINPNNNTHHHNIIVLKRNSESCKNMNNSNIHDRSFKSINSRTRKSDKSVQSINSAIRGSNFKLVKKDKNEPFMNRNISKIELYKNDRYEKKNKTFFKKQNKKQEYLRFLEKKYLALRANFIMNNIQETRGSKQELRALYNPLSV